MEECCYNLREKVTTTIIKRKGNTHREKKTFFLVLLRLSFSLVLVFIFKALYLSREKKPETGDERVKEAKKKKNNICIKYNMA